jgi:hypothetical protein
MPHPGAERPEIIKCRGTLHVQSLDNRLGSDIVRRGISENLFQLHPPKDIAEGCACSLGSAALTPGRVQKTPADISMEPERMTGRRWHDAGIAQELPIHIFEGPSAKAVLVERRHVPVKFGVARGAIQGPPKSRVTSGAALRLANASLSDSRQFRSLSRSERIIARYSAEV